MASYFNMTQNNFMSFIFCDAHITFEPVARLATKPAVESDQARYFNVYATSDDQALVMRGQLPSLPPHDTTQDASLSTAQHALLESFADRLEAYAERISYLMSTSASAALSKATTPQGFSHADIYVFKSVCRNARSFEVLLELKLVEITSVNHGLMMYRITSKGLAYLERPLPVYRVERPRFEYRDVLRSRETGIIYRVQSVKYDRARCQHIYQLKGFSGLKTVNSDDARLDCLEPVSSSWIKTLDTRL